jgi:L-tyrosine C(3)-methyltransferase
MADGRAGLPESAASLVPALFGHAAFQHLNAACQLGLHQVLHESPGLTASQIAKRLDLQDRPARILLIGTTSLNLTTLAGDRYHNSAAIEDLFADGAWKIFCDLVEFEASIAYLSHSNYVESLKNDTNAGLQWFPGTEPDLYRRLEHSPRLLELFYRCMNSWSRVANKILTESAWFDGCQHVLDVGGGDGVNALALVRAFPDVSVTILDLDGAVSIAKRNVDDAGLGARIQAIAGDMFTAAYPNGCDCVLLANQISIWSPAENLRLVTRAYDALPVGGRLVIFSEFVDDTLDGPLYAALDNVYFATLPTRQSQLYPPGDCVAWARAAGFREAAWFRGHSWTPHGAVIALK